MTAPLATDMYLPAFPSIATELNTSASLVSMTLVVFNIFLAMGVLLLGPISDKFGRKKPLLWSLVLYGIGNLVCFLAPDIWIFILGRVVQAFGGGGMISLSLAIVKDSFGTKQRGSIIAVLQSFTIIGPVIAPLLGAAVLMVASWRYVFMVLFLSTILEAILSIMYQETIPENEVNKGSVIATFCRIFVVAKNKKFSLILIIGSLFFAAFFAYLATGSFVYEEYFGLSETEFSLYFALNALLSLSGPTLSVVIQRKLSMRTSFNIMFVFGFISTACVFIFGHLSPITFFIAFVIYAATNSTFRPYATNILLDVHDGDTGSATALINFVFTIFGALGMAVGSIPFTDYVLCVAISMLIFIGLAAIVWLFSSRYIRK